MVSVIRVDFVTLLFKIFGTVDLFTAVQILEIICKPVHVVDLAKREQWEPL